VAKRKIDEQISYNWLFVLLAGIFMFVTGWAVWDETVTRREYKGYQERFFEIEQDLAKAEFELQRDLLDPAQCPTACAGMLEGKKDADKQCKAQCEIAAHYVELGARRQEIEATLRGPKAAEIQSLQAELAALKEAEFEVTQGWTFTKAEWSEQDYYSRKARQAYLANPDDAALKEASDAEHAKWVQLRDRANKEGAQVEAAIAKRKEGEAKLAAAKSADELKKITKQMEALSRPRDEAQRAYKKSVGNSGGLFGAKTSVIQYNMPSVDGVDRCTSCHVGTVRGGFEEVAEIEFRSHPFRRTLFAYHPPEDFGCTSCHDGQGRATTKFYAHAPSRDEDPHAFHTHYWERPLLRGPPGGNGTEFMQSKCRGCHHEQEELRSEIQCEKDIECAPLSTEKKPVTCGEPKPQGAAGAIYSFRHLPGTPEGAFPEEPPAKKLCVDRRGNPVVADLAPDYTAGVKIVEEAGCYGCHPIEGFKDLRKPAPDLVRADHKLDPGWAISWIQNPKLHRPNTRMPKFYPEMDDPDLYPYPVDVEGMKKQRVEEATAITAFLLDNSRKSTKYTYDMEPIPAGLSGDAKHGKELMGMLGCAACHNLPDDADHTPKRHNRASHFDHGPDLRDIGAKTSREWIYAWVRNPKSYSPNARMPNLRLTPQEALDVATYLKTLRGDQKIEPVTREQLADEALIAKGKQLVKDKGCYGCHLVEGYEEIPGIGAELSAFGVKLPERLDFGDYITDHNQQTWANWTINKLRHPRVYTYEAQAPVQTRMPEFGLTEAEIRKVMVFLKSLRGDADKTALVMAQKLSDNERKREQGRKLVRIYNCYGCHNIDGYDGELAGLPALSGSNSIFGPPPLDNEGHKAQPDWLFGFLKAPFRMRPLPKVRMPTFGFSDDEATKLVAMFSYINGAPYPFSDYGGIGPRDRDEYLVGKALFEAAKCQLCHVVGELGDGPLPPDVKAPNLLMGQKRLRPEWMRLWLADPAAMQKNTAMPSFWLGGNQMQQFLQTNPEFQAAVRELAPAVIQKYSDSPQLQIEAVRDYLFRLDQPAPPAKPGATAALRAPAEEPAP